MQDKKTIGGKLMLAVSVIVCVFVVSVYSSIPNPGHSASQVGSGVFYGVEGDVWSFPGSVGIGVVSPESPLHVSSASSSYGFIHLVNTASGGEAALSFRSSDQSFEDGWTVGKGVGLTGTGFSFYGNSATRLTITDNGSVGIGTTTPAYNLHVVGDIYASGNITCGGNCGEESGCPNTATNQMIRVGSFCIDKYEAYVVSGSVGSTNGGDTTAVAGSKPGVDPRASVTWFQAAQACANAGKRLCTNAEWQTAAAGTPDPGSDGGSTGCNVNSNAGTGAYADGSGTPANTGAHSACVSRWGVYDMAGNVWEWVADWGQAGLTWQTGDGSSAAPWPAGYGDDYTWNVNGRTYNGAGWVAGAPAALLRGGRWGHGAYAGVFALALDSAPSYSASYFGFRCCK